ncbi:hypothetical protein, conserved [Eimeria tenella]|uniref:Uncharacterized protein n=1 Tax=Eimeria tenella TaxID=5802 RepID=U6KV69_EIMTE|nr:hypothetical protein, conserved [Eimeria tenella]CDJ41866.1 hypothetical protein, conserved [Eimeria tenella]|eukprot:XP_013232616.1 hypothetical protein, conserved [Eimeria tenella]
MDPQPHAQLRDVLPSSVITDKKTNVHLPLERGQGYADGTLPAQRFNNGRLFLSSWAWRLGAGLTTLVAVYFLLRCSRLIGVERKSFHLTRSLAAAAGGLCHSKNAPDDDNGGYNGRLRKFAGFSGQQVLRDGSISRQDTSHGPPRIAQEEEPDEFLDDMLDEAGLDESGLDEAGLGSLPEECDGSELHLWEERKLPPSFKRRVLNVLRKMAVVPKVCSSLLPALTCAQRVRVTYHVMRLIALDLGALSLVREDLEPKRENVGDSLISLASECLQQSGEGVHLEGRRIAIRELMSLCKEIKQPRRHLVEKSPLKYKKKMISLLGTAGLAVKICLGALEGLSELMRNNSTKLVESIVGQQADVIEAIFRIHSDHIARDGSLRAHIIGCQKRTGVFALLGRYHMHVSRGNILPVKDLRERIIDAARSAGGLLPPRRPCITDRRSNSSALEGAPLQMSSQPRKLYGWFNHDTLHRQFASAVQISLQPTDSAVTGGALTRHLPTTYPQWRAGQTFTRGIEPVMHRVPYSLVYHEGYQVQLAPPQFSQPLVGVPLAWIQTPRPAAAEAVLPKLPATLPPAGPQNLGTADYSQGFDPPVSLQWGTFHPDGSGTLLQSASHESDGALDASSTSPSLQAVPKTGEYSLFGDGGVPPWSPFTAKLATLCDGQTSVTCGWTQGHSHRSTLHSAEDSQHKACGEQLADVPER